jgi:hypothetical protein
MKTLWPFSLRADYDRDVAHFVPPIGDLPAGRVVERDLAPLPAPVQRYLRVAGVVGQPHVHTVAARMHGRIRSGPGARWMPLVAEQHNVLVPAARLFYFDASMAGMPLQGYHRYADGSASMLVRLAGVIPVARASGVEMTRSETVTLFNDMCVLAPATLVSPAIAWEPVDGQHALARFTNGGHAIRAELSFNGAGELVDFRSHDRSRAAPGGRLERVRWSTPLGAYRPFGPVRLASTGEGRWHERTGAYAYIELTIDDVRYNRAP